MTGYVWPDDAECNGTDPDLADLLARHLLAVTPAGCWLWRGRGGHGYGVLTIGGAKGQLAHRVVYEIAIGPIPDGLELDHLCRTKRCVNPNHLEPVTHAENMRRWQATRPPALHCRNGHPLTEDNTNTSGGVRRCRTCRRITGHDWDQRHRRATA